jgi:hypothetical protein
VLLKAPGGGKHVANLQGIWGCYQDARRNTEAMAFRGHRLLDQVGPLGAGQRMGSCNCCVQHVLLLNYSVQHSYLPVHFCTSLVCNMCLIQQKVGAAEGGACWGAQCMLVCAVLRRTVCRCLLSTAASSERLRSRCRSCSMTVTRLGRSYSWPWWQAR